MRCPPRPLLTARQEQVLDLLKEGLTDRQIASTLGLSRHTVKRHVHALLSRVGTQRRIEAVARYADIMTHLCTQEAQVEKRRGRAVPAGSQTVAALRETVPECPPPLTPEEHFWLWVERGDQERADRCWTWAGPLGVRGQPRCYIKALRTAGLGCSARRIAYMLVHGVRLPREVVVVSACPHTHPRCVNPAHMRLRTWGQAPEWRSWTLVPARDRDG